MKSFISALLLIFASSAYAFTIEGSSYESAPANFNIASGGSGTISNCSVAANGVFVCDCEPNSNTGGGTCESAFGTDYESAAANCTIESNGAGTVSNCAISQNGTFVCSCCF